MFTDGLDVNRINPAAWRKAVGYVSQDGAAGSRLQRAELYRDLAVESGQIREDFYLQWHHLGKRTLLDVLSAENEHYGNQVSEITNRFDGYQAILRQYASAGTLARWLRDGQ